MIIISSGGIVSQKIRTSGDKVIEVEKSTSVTNYESLTRDELKVCLFENGISFQPNIKTNKMIELLKEKDINNG
jgi:hypothetical protein